MLANASSRLALWLPLIAGAVLLPSFLHGPTCGHDIAFHVESWLDAATQLQHGTLYPAWATTPAFNAGEPRFLFYPPLSWYAGALLFLAHIPATIITGLYIWLALSAAGLSMFFVARRFTTPASSLIAAALYIANPYMLFTALERSAFAELLAAAWIPWLFAAALRDRPRITSIAWPLALLWLTNAPAAVMGSYTLAILGLIRVLTNLRHREPVRDLLVTFISGAALGLSLTAVYLIPAAFDRRFVQITMAIVPGLSVPQNFLFAHTADAAHDLVNHQVSWIAIALLLTSALALAIAFARRNNTRNTELLLTLLTLTAVIAFLLVHPSQFLWLHLPELPFLQFPWRWLMVLAPTAALAIAIATPAKPTQISLALAALILLSLFASHHFLFACDPNESPRALEQLFHTSHGFPPTDEYTPGTADNDILRSDNPAFWLSTDPQSFAPGTVPNPNATQPDVDFGTPPPNQTLSQPTPQHFTINVPQNEFLILNLRDYPNWHVWIHTAAPGMYMDRSSGDARIQRDDGLIAVPIAQGNEAVDITWLPDHRRQLGSLVSLFALALFCFLLFRSRKIVVENHASRIDH